MNVYILLDRSGSMVSLGNEPIGSINAYVKKLGAKDHIHLAVFDDGSHDVIRDMPVEFYADITAEETSPRGGTPLYDSCNKIMCQAEDDNAEKTVLVVMTDGYENMSREFNQAQIQAKVKSWEDRKWEVVFLGANFDKVEAVSGSVGVASNKTLNFVSGNFMKGMDTLSASTMAYATVGRSINYTAEDKAALGS
jgi:hypothetical protein